MTSTERNNFHKKERLPLKRIGSTKKKWFPLNPIPFLFLNNKLSELFIWKYIKNTFSSSGKKLNAQKMSMNKLF